MTLWGIYTTMIRMLKLILSHTSYVRRHIHVVDEDEALH